MVFLANHVYERLTDIENITPARSVMLTERERDCVYWTAAGKTSGEVGIILEISENTVNHYLSSAAGKLDTANKAHTVAKAIRLGLLNSRL
ncbi:MAG: helix-turn-helix transcriptional regulator [Nitratireductor sp.]|nr:helix-turn-helix transcriptional regulator [Nitratireductor sp.]